MLIKRVFLFNLLVSAVLAITFILFPAPVLSLYGITGDASLLLLAKYFGTAHLSFAVLIYLALRANDARFSYFLAVSFFAGDLVGTIVLLFGQLQGLMNAAGWELVGLSALFAIAFGFITFTKSPGEN